MPTPRKKKTDNTIPQVPLGADGLPDLPVNAPIQAGTCPACFEAARVGVHRRGGYYIACVRCGFRGFTSTQDGAVLFRAAQQVLKEPDIRSVLFDLVLPRAEALVKQQTAPTRPGASST